ncbi:MAG: elongation factor P maturation arginine rhamnosyltransferase EarP [Lautropia sp.]
MAAGSPAPRRWTLICRVVDNFGDAAVLWRLARQLAAEHDAVVRLAIDRVEVLARLVPGAAAGRTLDGVAIERLAGDAPLDPVDQTAGAALAADTDVIVTGFHARLPAATRARVGGSGGRRPLLIQLEHLSAEAWVEGCHGLPSPGADGIVEHFFYPGFSAATGGLLREADLAARRAAFAADPDAARRQLAAVGVARAPGEHLATLLCYPSAPLDALAAALAASRCRLRLLAPHDVLPQPGLAERLQRRSRGRLALIRIPFVAQRDYDALLWSCDLNFVRGEDSWLRGLWSGRPFLWQAYPQADAVHHDKLNAFLDRFDPAPPLAAWLEANRGWNGLAATTPVPALLDQLDAIAAAIDATTAGWLAAPGNASDLARRLVEFAEHRL